MSSHGKSSLGFTLIEILVVIVIIGIIASSAASLMLRDRSAENLKTESDRLISLINLAKEEAVLQSKELAIYFDREGYSFFELLEGKWQIIRQDPLLRSRKLMEGIRLELELEGTDTLLPDPAEVFTLESGIDKESEEEENKKADGKDQEKGAKENKKKKKDEVKPQVFILSSSEVSPFQIILSAGDNYEVTIKSDALGNLEIIDPDKT